MQTCFYILIFPVLSFDSSLDWTVEITFDQMLILIFTEQLQSAFFSLENHKKLRLEIHFLLKKHTF